MPLRRLLLWLFPGLAGLCLAVGAAHAADVLRILTWPGYADADLVKRFEERHGVRVEVTLVSSDDNLRERLAVREGAEVDVLAANTAEIQRFVDQGLVQPLDLASIPNIRNQLPRFRDLAAIPGITRNGAVFALPYTYAEMGLIYDRDQLPTPPTSLADLWDKRHAGKVLAFDGSSHNFSLAALSLGHSHPFQLDENGYRSAIRRLVALRRNVLTFYSTPEESVDLFRRHRARLLFANYGSQQVKLLQQAGANIGYIIPREGALAWLDCWAVSRGAKNKRLAESWINYTLEPAVSAALTRRQGLANTIDESPVAGEKDKIVWLQPVEDADKRSALWSRILSGDRPERF